jgi:hypothetical protein
MNVYIFILGIYNRTDAEMRFEHRVVTAESIDAAYDAGQKEAEKAGLIPVADDETANDYVIQLIAE